MRCIRCGSHRVMRFIDGFGERRIFCKNCWGSFLEESVMEFGIQKDLRFLSQILHDNPKALRMR